jgi:transposase
MDKTGAIGREMMVPSHPEDLVRALERPAWCWSASGRKLAPCHGGSSVHWRAICIETRHMKALLEAQVNRTDHNDVHSIAQMM